MIPFQNIVSLVSEYGFMVTLAIAGVVILGLYVKSTFARQKAEGTVQESTASAVVTLGKALEKAHANEQLLREENTSLTRSYVELSTTLAAKYDLALAAMRAQHEADMRVLNQRLDESAANYAAVAIAHKLCEQKVKALEAWRHEHENAAPKPRRRKTDRAAS